MQGREVATYTGGFSIYTLREWTSQKPVQIKTLLNDDTGALPSHMFFSVGPVGGEQLGGREPQMEITSMD